MKTSTLKILYNLLVLASGLGLALLWAGQASSAAGVQDLWFARALGRALSDPAGLPAFESFSHTIAADQPFRASAWLFSILVYQLGKSAPAWAFDAWRVAMFGLLFVSLVAASYRRGARPFSSALFALTALAGFYNAGLGMVSTAALFALALYIMEGPFWASLFSRWLWLAPLLALAANLDDSALAIGILAAAWAISDKDLPTEAPPDNPMLSRMVFAAALASCLALNFNGFGLWTQLGAGAWNLPAAQTAAPLGLALLKGQWMAPTLAAVAAFFLVANSWVEGGQHRWRRDLVCGLSMVAVVAVRPDWILLLGLWAAPVAASRLDAVVSALGPAVRQARWLGKLPVLAALLWSLLLVKSHWQSKPVFAQRAYPDRVIGFLREHDAGMRLYQPADLSGFLLWYLPGRLQVFLDPRGPSSYPADVLSDYHDASAGGLGGPRDQLELWREIFNRRQVDTALLKVDSPLAKTMARASGWQPVSFDNESVLYVRAKKYPGLVKTWAPRGLRPGDLEDPFDPGRLQMAEADVEVALARDPGMGILYLFQGAVHRAHRRPGESLESLRRGIAADPQFAPNYNQLGVELARKGLLPEARKLWKKSLSLREDARVRALLAGPGEQP